MVLIILICVTWLTTEERDDEDDSYREFLNDVVLCTLGGKMLRMRRWMLLTGFLVMGWRMLGYIRTISRGL